MPRRNPLALLAVAIEPMDRSEFSRLLAAARELLSTVVQHVDPEPPRMILAGPDELTLDDAVGRLKADHGLALHIGAPAVAYLETVLRTALVDYTHKAAGDAPAFARLVLSLEPHSHGGGFVPAMSGEGLPERFIAAVAGAVEEGLAAGPCAGFPVVDVRVALRDGAFHDTDSSPDAFRIAALRALREGLVKAGSALLEPLVTITVTTPADCVETVEADLRSRRARDFARRIADDAMEVEAVVPLANTFGYVNSLNEISRKRATYTLAFARDEIVGGGDDDPFSPAAAIRA